jgi:WD40 repeat protein
MTIRKVLFLAGAGLGLLALLYLTLMVRGPQRAIFRGHTGPILGVTATSDGKILASWSQDGMIKLWDVAAGRECATLRSHACHVAFSPDGKTLAATGWDDRTVRLWNLNLGRGWTTFGAHLADVSSVAFSPDGRTLASGGQDGAIRLWEVDTGVEQASLRGHVSHVECLAFSPDGKTLASGDGVGAVKLWDVASGKNTATLNGHREELECVAFSLDGRTLASLCIEETIHLWDTASRQHLATRAKSYGQPRPRLLRFLRNALDSYPSLAAVFPGLAGERTLVPVAVVFTPEGNLLALGYDAREDATVRMWQVLSPPLR